MRNRILRICSAHEQELIMAARKVKELLKKTNLKKW